MSRQWQNVSDDASGDLRTLRCDQKWLHVGSLMLRSEADETQLCELAGTVAAHESLARDGAATPSAMCAWLIDSRAWALHDFTAYSRAFEVVVREHRAGRRREYCARATAEFRARGERFLERSRAFAASDQTDREYEADREIDAVAGQLAELVRRAIWR
jgi:hypothetical protein